MSQAQIDLKGLAELRKLIGEFAGEATEQGQILADAAAERAAEEIRAAYPEGPTGNLRRGVRVVKARGESGHRVLSIVKSTARHAHFYERGTRRQPARPVVGEVAQRVRRTFYRELVDMVRAVSGADVSGVIG
jgi:hypothetical protein